MSSSTDTQKKTFFLELNPDGDGGAYHIKNEESEINRPNIVDRGDSLVVQADLVTVVHGSLTDSASPRGAPATLVISDFRFLPSKARRFTWAKITYKFSGLSPELGGVGGTGPAVVKLAPGGHFSLHPSPVHVEKGWNTGAALGVPVGPVAPSVTFGWELKKSYDVEDQVSLSGVARLMGRDTGPKNTAIWELGENETTGGGIPTRLRTAIVLKHKVLEANARFQATVKIEVDADLRSKLGFAIQRVLGKIPKDDPIIFDPTVSMASDGLDVKHPENLVKEDLTQHYLVETTTRLGEDGKPVEAHGSAEGEAEG
ncbi:hypothetical protein CEP52_010009 [Fusarium oligoseptatum]|uniref:Uncharacterized protein n=1 Tax=Fusarium oligoseptatum TaxID=2604345 RepID=A0A428TAG0_9HYPO|nr:hypothetical protein CEP52_010009 [Fusarium oligoseptatum]